MENINQEYYLYPQRYQTRSDKNSKIINNIKGTILEFIAKREKLKKKFNVWESYSLDKKQWIEKHNLFIDNVTKEKYFYKNINLTDLSFFEVIEIDNFNRFRKKLISKFGDSPDLLGRNRKEELVKNLTNVENKFDNISSGRLFSIGYEKHQTTKNDLIDSIQCYFIKTNESYFIISFDISLSDKAKEVFQKIINQDDIELSYPGYNSFLNILKTKRFYHHFSFIPSLRAFNIQNLISDINIQVKNNVTKFFDGYFHSSKIFKILPSVRLFEVEDIEEFKSDKTLKFLYGASFGRYYALDDKQIEIHLSRSWSSENEVFHIIKQKGHGNRETSKSDLTNWDGIESHFLIRSLTFPCVFSGILKEQTLKLNTLKRQIYDQVKQSGTKYIFKHFFLLGINRKYMKLKHKSIQILLTIKRFENEFTDRDLKFYTRDFELHKFNACNIRKNEEKDLLSFLISSFRYKMDLLNTQTKSLNDVFKSLEEFNSYKTNFILQLFSIFIAILAFMFAFDETKKFVLTIINKLIE